MMVEASDYISKAKQHLRDAQRIADISMHHVAARESYLAAFDAAEAFVFQRSGRSAKTHPGLRVVFNRLASEEPRIPRQLVAFLAQGYEIKSAVDYDIDPATPPVSEETATAAISTASQFIETIERLLQESPASDQPDGDDDQRGRGEP